MVDKHQQIMNEAYSIWQNNDNMNYNEFIAELDQIQALAVLTGNLNYQVGNGGFSQWNYNGYSSEADKLLVLLSFYKKEPVVAQVIELVEEALKIISKYESQIEEARSDWDSDYEEVEYLENKMHEELGKLDNKYYEIDDEFMKYMNKVFIQQEVV